MKIIQETRIHLLKNARTICEMREFEAYAILMRYSKSVVFIKGFGKVLAISHIFYFYRHIYIYYIQKERIISVVNIYSFLKSKIMRECENISANPHKIRVFHGSQIMKFMRYACFWRDYG